MPEIRRRFGDEGVPPLSEVVNGAVPATGSDTPSREARKAGKKFVRAWRRAAQRRFLDEERAAQLLVQVTSVDNPELAKDILSANTISDPADIDIFNSGDYGYFAIFGIYRASRKGVEGYKLKRIPVGYTLGP